jgi:hypothetical protein
MVLKNIRFLRFMRFCMISNIILLCGLIFINTYTISTISECRSRANIWITLDIFSCVLPGLQEAVEKFDRAFDGDANQNSDPNVSKKLANIMGVECRPYRSRTCDTLIKSQSIYSGIY